MTDAPLRVFLSHSWDDAPFAAKLRQALDRAGAVPFDPIEGPGEDWTADLKTRLDAADLVVFVVPPREGAGKNALMELGAARVLGKKIIAVVPMKGRWHNADFARLISDLGVLDASEMPEAVLAGRIVEAARPH